MEKNLENYRRSYEKHALRRKDLEEHPMLQFQNWFLESEEMEQGESNAMTLGTIGKDGFPKNRVVLLKNYSQDGFGFYTNYESEKGKAIAENPNVCLSFFWPDMERQVIIKGKARKVSKEISDKYFESRPLGSRYSAMVSNQSEVVKNRGVLENKLKELQEKFPEGKFPRPKHWGGFLVKPVSVEFWQGRANRLHDRFRYILKNNTWKIERLEP
jgi:pyridoxamine 5'-phosphate oxidase